MEQSRPGAELQEAFGERGPQALGGAVARGGRSGEYWPIPQDPQIFDVEIQAEEVAAPSRRQGRLAALWGDLTINRDTNRDFTAQNLNLARIRTYTGMISATFTFITSLFTIGTGIFFVRRALLHPSDSTGAGGHLE